MELTANQRYKQSGTNLSFKDWIEREKDKGIFIPNNELNSIINQEKDNLENLDLSLDPKTVKNDTFLGVNKWVIISGTVIVSLGILYKIYYKRK